MSVLDCFMEMTATDTVEALVEDHSVIDIWHEEVRHLQTEWRSLRAQVAALTEERDRVVSDRDGLSNEYRIAMVQVTRLRAALERMADSHFFDEGGRKLRAMASEALAPEGKAKP